jgi:uncharacterized protein with ATP-grasp and redox domains
VYDVEAEAIKEEKSFIEKKIQDRKKELDILRERFETKEIEIRTLEEIGDSAMYVSDVLDMFAEYKKREYSSCQKLLEDMETDILNTIAKGD